MEAHDAHLPMIIIACNKVHIEYFNQTLFWRPYYVSGHTQSLQTGLYRGKMTKTRILNQLEFAS